METILKHPRHIQQAAMQYLSQAGQWRLPEESHHHWRERGHSAWELLCAASHVHLQELHASSHSQTQFRVKGAVCRQSDPV